MNDTRVHHFVSGTHHVIMLSLYQHRGISNKPIMKISNCSSKCYKTMAFMQIKSMYFNMNYLFTVSSYPPRKSIGKPENANTANFYILEFSTSLVLFLESISRAKSCLLVRILFLHDTPLNNYEGRE